MQTFWGVLRVLGGCGIVLFMLAVVVAVLVVGMMITLRVCAFIPMSKRQHQEPGSGKADNPEGSTAANP